MPDRRLFLQLATASQYVGQILDRELETVGLPAYLFNVRRVRRARRAAGSSER